MRLDVTLHGQGDLVLPVEHAHILQAAVYEMMGHPALRQFVHDEGFDLGSRRFKLFTFSRLLGRARHDVGRRSMVFQLPVRFVVCSPLGPLLKAIGKTLLARGEVRFHDRLLAVGSVRCYEDIVCERQITVRMLSPIVAYSTLEVEGKKYTHYYSPFEPRFRELVGANLRKKHLLVFGRDEATDDFDISPERVGPRDEKILKFKGTVIKGWMGVYRLTGPPSLLRMALEAGIGSKNSQGFGCCELVNRLAQ